MAKSIFGAGLLEGILLGIFVKTGLDISQPGIALMVIDSLKSLMTGSGFIPISIIIIFLTVFPWILLISNIQENGLPFVVGLILGFFLIVIF